ncbi:MAG TPA: TolC family protein [Gemmatimonadales bacterium]|nr:TolC family protein [Gemmatimonadales bacterium]
MRIRHLLFAALAAAPSTARAQAPAALSAPLTLAGAVRLGQERAIGAALARLGVHSSELKASEQTGHLLPTLDADGTYSRQTNNLATFGLSIPGFPVVTPDFNLYTLDARASQVLFDGGLFNRIAAARTTAGAARYDARSAADQAGAAAGLAYLRVLSAQETVTAREADSAVAADLLHQAQQLRAAGVSAAIDVTRAEVNAAAVRTQLLMARTSLDRARIDLAQALDLPADTTLVLADSLGGGALTVPVTPDSAVAYALAHRPEAAAERERSRVAELSRRAILWEDVPTLGLFGSYNYAGTRTDQMNGTYQVGIRASVPIFDGLRRQRRYSESGDQVDAQALREHALLQQVEVDARTAVLDLQSARDQVALAGERLDLAEQELAQSDERFKAGVAGSVETSNSQAGLIQARDAYIQAKVNFATARLRTYRALGALDQMP